MISKILVTTDLSDESKVAFPWAKELARKFNASISVLAVVEDLAQTAMLTALEGGFLPEGNVQKELLEKVQSELTVLVAAEFQGLAHNHKVLQASSSVPHEIVEYAATEKVDLILIAAHGRTGLSRWIIGSVTERVVREAKCAVLVVPAKS